MPKSAKKKKNLPGLLTLLKFLVYIWFIALLFCAESHGQQSIKLKPVVVAATRITGREKGERMSTRNSDSIEIGEDKSLSYSSVPSILEEYSKADVRTRGPYGVQADISLRGAPFEENLVMLDGISLNDPKTGHHNMDLPLTLYDMQEVDVIYGPASSVYGSGALGGAVNIIPKTPDDKPGFYASSSVGSWDFYSGLASLNIPLGNFKNRTSVEWRRSTGYAPETEFDILTASSYTRATFENAKFDIFLGYLTKKFGADSFYSNLYSNEEESINTGLVYVKGEVVIPTAEVRKFLTSAVEEVRIRPNVYWKRLQDKFILDRNRPAFSRNDHTTNMYGGEISAEFATGAGDMVFGAGMGNEDIESTNLGDHYRIKQNVFFEYEKRIFNLLLNASARFDYYSTFGCEISPSAGLAYEIFPQLAIRARAAKGFRVPTFTELYYTSPANEGNPDLKPEKAWTYEAGLDYNETGIKASATAFLRNTEKIIDWTRESLSDPWQAENIGEFDMFGVEISGKIEFDKITDIKFLKEIKFEYEYLEGLDKKGVTSKYVLEYLKHNFNLALKAELPFGFTEELNFSFRKRIGESEYFLLNSTLYKAVQAGGSRINFFLKVDNIFNTCYTGEGDIKMPGAAVFGGASVKF